MQPRQVPGIAQLRPNISRDNLPKIQSPLAGMLGPQPEPPAIGEQLQELAMEIYARLAVKHLGDDHYTEPLSHEHLRALAKHSQIAARAYFETMVRQSCEKCGDSPCTCANY